MSLRCNNPRLTVELIPSTCHFSNVRTTIRPVEWDKIRKLSYEAANHRCEICSESGKNQGYKHSVECHEIWGYDDKNHIQKLIGLISLCPLCHQVKHIGRAAAIGKQAQCFAQLERVNGWDHKEVVGHVAESFEVYKQRSSHKWRLDLSILNQEPYNLNIDTDKKRLFKVKKYKKRRKKKKFIS